MPDWLIVWLGQIQGGIVRTLAVELRAGGLGTAGLAFGLGALHALTPGHGKAALAAFFLGRDSKVRSGVRVALTAALLHVLSGFVIFIALRIVAGGSISMLGRGPPSFTVLGYGLIIVSGALMIWQGLQRGPSHSDGAGPLTAGIGLLPCPLTISVLGFAWTQASLAMLAVVLVSLSLGIATTIGLVALAAILGRQRIGAALEAHLPDLERWSRRLQVAAGALIVALGIVTIGRAGL